MLYIGGVRYLEGSFLGQCWKIYRDKNTGGTCVCGGGGGGGGEEEREDPGIRSRVIPGSHTASKPHP